MNNLATAYDEAKQFDKAEVLHRERLPLLKQKAGGDSPAYAGALAAFGLNLLHQKKWTEAEPLLRECLAIREKTQPDAWTTFNTKSLLGGALLGQKKYADAEPLLLAGYEGMKQRAKTIPPPGKARLPEAIERLVQLYEATGQKGRRGEVEQGTGRDQGGAEEPEEAAMTEKAFAEGEGQDRIRSSQLGGDGHAF